MGATEVKSPLLAIEGLSIAFPTSRGEAHAVRQLDLTLAPGEIFGLVGESGCGKSLTSLAILRLVPSPGRISAQRMNFAGQDLLSLSDEGMRRLRGSRIALIPQDPLTALNPVYTIGDQLAEVLIQHEGLSKRDALSRAAGLLDQVRLPNAKSRLNDYPHQFSGGMRQRVMIAMALSCSPELLIADEPTTALDVTVQAQILDLLRELQQAHQSTVLLITHDLGVVAELCDTVAVMYAGRMVEQAPVETLFARPQHPYTQGLLHSLPQVRYDANGLRRRERLEPVEGQPPALTEIPTGCAFEPRCGQRITHCLEAFPAVTTMAPGHWTRCFAVEAANVPAPPVAG